jgi:hypothetical protein
MLEKKFLTSEQRELVLRIAREYKQGTKNIHLRLALAILIIVDSGSPSSKQANQAFRGESYGKKS